MTNEIQCKLIKLYKNSETIKSLSFTSLYLEEQVHQKQSFFYFMLHVCLQNIHYLRQN